MNEGQTVETGIFNQSNKVKETNLGNRLKKYGNQISLNCWWAVGFPGDWITSKRKNVLVS